MLTTKNHISEWVSSIVNHPIKAMLVTMAALSIFALGLPKFGVNPSARDYLGSDRPLVQDLIKLEQEYVEDMNIFVMLMPDDGNVFSRETLTAVEYLTDKAWGMPNVRRVDSISNYQHTRADGDDLVVDFLVRGASGLTNKEVNYIKQVAVNEPALVNMLVDKKGHATAINISLSIDLSNVEDLTVLTDSFESIKADFSQIYPNITLYESGYANMISHWQRAVYHDVEIAFSASILIIFFGLMLFFANFRATIAVLLIGSIPVIAGMGALGLVGEELNPSSILGTLMVLVLGLADGIHVTKSVRRLLSEGREYKDAIKESITSNFTPIFLTSATTAIGFLTFKFSGYDGVAVLGYYVAFGVIMAFLLSVTLLPALLCFCGLKPEKKRANSRWNHAFNHKTFTAFIVKYQRLIVVLLVPSIFLSLYFISQMKVDERVTRYLDKNHIFSLHLDKIQENLTGGTNMIYNFNSGREGGVAAPEFMRKVDAFVQWASAQPEVRHVAAYTNTMKRLNRDMHNNASEFYRLPESQELASQYLLLYELSLPYGLDLTNQVNIDKSGTRIVVTTNDLSTVQARDLVNRSDDYLGKNAPDFNKFANSDTVLTLLMVEESIEIVIISAITALVFIGLILLFTFRSFNAGLLCVLSVTMPILITFGLWGIFVGRVGLPGALSVCMVIGVSVDFSVHFISKFVYARRNLAYEVKDSISYAYALVTGPVVTSIIVLGGGFVILRLSWFEYNVVMGTITATCIMFSALSALVLVPSMMLIERFSVK